VANSALGFALPPCEESFTLSDLAAFRIIGDFRAPPAARVSCPNLAQSRISLVTAVTR
jgi:hypothetical protein